MKKINWENIEEIRGYYNMANNSWEAIDQDQIRLDGFCVYEKYVLVDYEGKETEIRKESMQTEVNSW